MLTAINRARTDPSSVATGTTSHTPTGDGTNQPRSRARRSAVLFRHREPDSGAHDARPIARSTFVNARALFLRREPDSGAQDARPIACSTFVDAREAFVDHASFGTVMGSISPPPFHPSLSNQLFARGSCGTAA
jgi:hypothetical protein